MLLVLKYFLSKLVQCAVDNEQERSCTVPATVSSFYSKHVNNRRFCADPLECKCIKTFNVTTARLTKTAGSLSACTACDICVSGDSGRVCFPLSYTGKTSKPAGYYYKCSEIGELSISMLINIASRLI